MVDWSSTGSLVVVLSTVVLAALSIFFSEAVRDLYTLIKRKIWSTDPKPVLVGRNFRPENYAPESGVWAKEHFIADKLEAGYSCYKDPADGATRFRISNPSDPQPVYEYFMLKPDAHKTNGTD